LRRTLLVVEVGLTVVLLIASGLLLKSYARLRLSELGCTTRNVLTMRINLFGGGYREPSQRVNFFRVLLDRARALPGVEAVGFAPSLPGQGYWGDDAFTIVEHPPLPQGTIQVAINREVDPGYFRALGIPILRGQGFDPGRVLDKAGQTVISAAFARRYFPGEDPIGKHLHYRDKNWEIAGVVGDTRYALNKAPEPMQYYPLFSGGLNNGVLVVRSSRDVEQYALPVQHIVRELDPDMPVSNVLTMDQLLGRETLDASFNATLLAVFAGLSLLLAGVGLFGVLSYIVAQRTGEIGIRIALGARREQVLRKMLLDGLRPALLGLAIGLAGSVAAARGIQAMLYGTQALDPAVFAGVSLTLLLVAALACLVPAWRASRLDPIRALRTE
jgi:predicted permease